MPYSIEMFFDEAGDARVRSLASMLTSAGTPFLGDVGSRPHVSLAVADSLDIPATCLLLDRFASATAPFPLSLTSIGFFPGDAPVAFLAPKVTPDLLILHAGFAAEFAAVAQGIWKHYSPSAWAPHCTLTMAVQPDRLADVLGARFPIDVTVTSLALVEFRPVKRLCLSIFSKR
jgi:2'-5' RNA ligase